MLFLDQHDATALYNPLSQVVDVQIAPLNPDLPDLYWIDCESKSRGISRKQVTEVLAGLERVEEQLSRDYEHVDKLYLLVEGILVAEGYNEAFCFERTGDWFRKYGKPHRHDEGWQFSVLGYRKKLESFRQWGIEVIEVPDRNAFITEVQSLYEHSQREFENHDTFRRVLKTKFDIPKADPFVRTLMGIVDNETGRSFIGEETANALKAAGLKSVADVIHAPNLSNLKLKSGRRIGEAMEARIRKALC